MLYSVVSFCCIRVCTRLLISERGKKRVTVGEGAVVEDTVLPALKVEEGARSQGNASRL